MLQHGFLGGSGYWAPQFPEFDRAFDVIAPDLPGFAASASEGVRDSIEGLAAAVVELLDALNIARFNFVGHSLGGMIAQQIALDHPDRVEKIVLYGTAPRGELPGRFETVARSLARLRSEGVAACAARIVPTWFVEGTQAAMYESCLEAGRGTSLEAAERALESLARWDVRHRLAEIRRPVLIVCGDRDRSTGLSEALSLHERICDSQLFVAPGCAHNVHLERPSLFNTVVGEFLRDRGP